MGNICFSSSSTSVGSSNLNDDEGIVDIKRDMMSVRFLTGLTSESRLKLKAANVIGRDALKQGKLDTSVSAIKRYGVVAPFPALSRNFGGEAALRTAFELLIESGCENQLNLPDDKGNTPLMESIRWQNKDMMNLLLSHPTVDINHRNPQGDSALTFVIASRRDELIHCLSKRNELDWNLPSSDGNTPLMQAVLTENDDLVYYILQRFPTIDIQVRNHHGSTALDLAKPGSEIHRILNVAHTRWVPAYRSGVEFFLNQRFPQPIGSIIILYNFI